MFEFPDKEAPMVPANDSKRMVHGGSAFGAGDRESDESSEEYDAEPA